MIPVIMLDLGNHAHAISLELQFSSRKGREK